MDRGHHVLRAHSRNSFVKRHVYALPDYGRKAAAMLVIMKGGLPAPGNVLENARRKACLTHLLKEITIQELP